MTELHGKVAVVTGGASGIGAATCALLAERGARVVVTDIDDERGEAVAAALGEHGVYLHTDVTREEDVAAAIRTATERFGRLDAMVNNAGRVGAWTYVADTTVDEWDSSFAMLARSAFLGTKHAAGVMREQGFGAIVNVSSVAGVRTGFGPHPYGAAKAAVLQLTRSAARELAEFRVRVNAVTPGGVATGSSVTEPASTATHWTPASTRCGKGWRRSSRSPAPARATTSPAPSPTWSPTTQRS